MIYLFLALGGAAGTLARFAVAGWVHSWAGTTFPWGTFVVNLAGSFLLGFAMRGSEALVLSAEVRALVTVGFCGAFTTFSTFSLETVALIERGAWGRAAAYGTGSVALGLVALSAGVAAAGAMARPAM